MIIKKNKAQQLQQQHPRHPAGQAGLPEPDHDWNEDAVEQGLVPDRRAEDRRAADRRRGYRRIEDKSLITKAHEEANAIRENAYRQGFEEGMSQVEAEVRELRDKLDDLLVSRDQVLESIADDIAPLAVEIAERIIKTEVSCDEELINAIVQDTIQKVGRNTKSILIKVHPDDVRIVKEGLKNHPPSNMNAEIMVMDDPTVDRGSCVVETNSGLIDASFSTRLEILRRLFGNNHGGESPTL